MGSYSEFFLNSRRDVVQLELVEVTHPNFTQPYRIVRNAPRGVTVNLSADEPQIAFTYFPARVSQQGARDDLDSSIQIDLGDLGEVIPGEVDAVREAGGSMTKPALRYWAFRSDELAAPIYGPIALEIPSISFSEEGASFEARAPTLNSAKTGERWTLDRIPMLRGFV